MKLSKYLIFYINSFSENRQNQSKKPDFIKESLKKSVSG